MRRFILQVGLFCLFIFCLIQLPRFLVNPVWGNTVLNQKYRFLQDHIEEYDVIYIGSSRVHRHFNSLLIDSLYSDAISSFNLGAPATYIPEMYVAYNSLKNNHDLTKKTIFLELQSFTQIAEVNKKSLRSTYYIDKTVYNFVNSFHQDLNRVPSLEIDKYFYKKSLIYNFLNYKGFRGQLESLISGNDSSSFAETSGFVGREKYVLDKNQKLAKYDKLKRQYKFFQRVDLVNNFHYEFLMNMILDAETEGYKIVFVMLPLSFHNITALFDQLPESNKLNLADPTTHSELYDQKYYFDTGHFNTIGANLFSTIFAKKCQENNLILY